MLFLLFRFVACLLFVGGSVLHACTFDLKVVGVAFWFLLWVLFVSLELAFIVRGGDLSAWDWFWDLLIGGCVPRLEHWVTVVWFFVWQCLVCVGCAELVVVEDCCFACLGLVGCLRYGLFLGWVYSGFRGVLFGFGFGF